MDLVRRDSKIAHNLAELITDKFESALLRKTIVYAESTEVVYYEGRAFRYQIRIVPSFATKPYALNSQAAEPRLNSEATAKSSNPLLNVSPKHVVAEAGPFRIILNKYCALRNQILFTSAAPRSQTEPLDASELSTVYRALKVLPRGHIAFYNCGKDSGASQPHKHVQIVALEHEIYRDLYPNRVLSESVSSGARGTLIQHPAVPYVHFIARVTEKCTGAYLQALFGALLSATESALNEQRDAPQRTPAYNFLMTPEWLMMVPRTNPGRGKVGVNSLGMLGMLWFGDGEQLRECYETGFDEILIHSGLRKMEEEALG